MNEKSDESSTNTATNKNTAPTTVSATTTSTTTTTEPKIIEAGKEAAMEAEVKAARERAIIPLEIRMKQFRDMLSEKEVLIFVCCERLTLSFGLFEAWT